MDRRRRRYEKPRSAFMMGFGAAVGYGCATMIGAVIVIILMFVLAHC